MSEKRRQNEQTQEVTRLLIALSEGEVEATDKLIPFVYSELRRLAGSYLKNEREGHTLQPTALVHEAFLKLVDQNVRWEKLNTQNLQNIFRGHSLPLDLCYIFPCDETTRIPKCFF